MDRTKRKAIFKMQRQVVGIAVLLIAVVFVAKNCQWKRHYVEGRNVPNSIGFCAAANTPFDSFTIEISTHFRALPAHWYCTEWSGGGGPKPVSTQKSYSFDKTGEILMIPLVYPDRSFCPYLVTSVCVRTWSKINDTRLEKIEKYIDLFPANPVSNTDFPTLPDTMAIKFRFENGRVTFAGPTNEWFSLSASAKSRDAVVIKLEEEAKHE